MVKRAKSLCDEYKVSLRNVRRDAVERVKKEQNAKQVDKDTSKFYQVRTTVRM
jgi:ribosome recycling factor